MSPHKTTPVPRWLIASALLCFATPGFAAVVTGAIGSHDPSRIINCDGVYYLYSTGGRMKYSTDLITWANGPSPFPSPMPAPGGTPPPAGAQTPNFRQFRGSRAPASVKALIPVDQGIWAPDVIYYNQKYYLYYSVAARDGQSTAIGLLTSPTLDPASPAYHWTDAGVVTSDHDKVDHRSSIDPCPFVDAGGDLWLSYGSGYANGTSAGGPTIFIMKLDNATGLASSAGSNRYPVAFGHIEASYVYPHSGYYYLFWNSGGCCNGAKSSYAIHVARSRTVTGPYLDKSGKPNSAATIFLPPTVLKNSVDGNEHGPGQIGILSEGGIDRCTYHYYPDNGRPVIGEETIVWGPDGWPKAGADLAPGTYKITSTAAPVVLGVRGQGAADAPVEGQSDSGNPYQRWTVAFAGGSGTNANGYYTVACAGSGKALGMVLSNPPGAAGLVQSAPTGGDDQQWIIEETSDEKYRIISRATRGIVSVSAGGSAAGPGISVVHAGAVAQIGAAQEWDFSAP